MDTIPYRGTRVVNANHGRYQFTCGRCRFISVPLDRRLDVERDAREHERFCTRDALLRHTLRAVEKRRPLHVSDLLGDGLPASFARPVSIVRGMCRYWIPRSWNELSISQQERLLDRLCEIVESRGSYTYNEEARRELSRKRLHAIVLQIPLLELVQDGAR